MKTNPGGQIPIDEICGRDALIAELWAILEGRSVVMTAERRIGKTSIIRKMEAQPPGGWIPVLQDLERIHSADEFAVSVFEQVRKHLSLWKKAALTATKFLHDIGGTEIGGVVKLPEGKQGHWKTLLTRSIEDLVAHQKPDRLVFFWDEMPYMLDSIRSREGEATAMEILDVLRALRQGTGDFRMVLTGSIGLHHVLGSLRDAGYRNEPVNDMDDVEVMPLAPEDARELARRLIEGEGLTASDPGRSAESVAELGDGVPFYIHHIVRQLRVSGRPPEPGQVSEVVQEQLLAANDPWELAHYRDRIPSYYPKDAKLVFAILDTLATCDQPASVNDVFSAIKSAMTFDDRERLLDLLKLLQRDHYLMRSKDGRFGFRFPMIRRWWRLDRGL